MNKLEESWNEYKKNLVSKNYFVISEDRLHFQAGFNAAAKLFRKSNTTQQSSGQETPCDYCSIEDLCVQNFCPRCGRKLRR